MNEIQIITPSKLRLALCLIVSCAIIMGASINPLASSMQEPVRLASHSDIGKVKARGAFTADFGIPAGIPGDQIVPVIESDRVIMSARPGMQNKYLPLKIDFNTGNLLSGGRYLFDTERAAEEYLDWVENDFIVDGIHFFDRPIFLNPDYHAWRVIGAHHFAEIDKRVIVRTERWSVPGSNQTQLLRQKWHEVRDEAERRGLTSVWLLYSRGEDLVQVVYFADRVAPPDPNSGPDFASLAALENSEPLGNLLSFENWTKTFDRTQWILTIWFPFVEGDQGTPPLWPHSPPLPGPQ